MLEWSTIRVVLEYLSTRDSRIQTNRTNTTGENFDIVAIPCNLAVTAENSAAVWYRFGDVFERFSAVFARMHGCESPTAGNKQPAHSFIHSFSQYLYWLERSAAMTAIFDFLFYWDSVYQADRRPTSCACVSIGCSQQWNLLIVHLIPYTLVTSVTYTEHDRLVLWRSYWFAAASLNPARNSDVALGENREMGGWTTVVVSCAPWVL